MPKKADSNVMVHMSMKHARGTKGKSSIGFTIGTGASKFLLTASLITAITFSGMVPAYAATNSVPNMNAPTVTMSVSQYSQDELIKGMQAATTLVNTLYGKKQVTEASLRGIGVWIDRLTEYVNSGKDITAIKAVMRSTTDALTSMNLATAKSTGDTVTAYNDTMKKVLQINKLIGIETSKTQVYNDGKRVDFPDVQPFAENGRTYMPLRAIAENFGFKVEWLQAEYSAKVSSADTTLQFPIDSNVFLKNGRDSKMDVKSTIRNGRTVLPFRYVAEALGLQVDYRQVSGVGVVFTFSSGTSKAEMDATINTIVKEVELSVQTKSSTVLKAETVLEGYADNSFDESKEGLQFGGVGYTADQMYTFAKNYLNVRLNYDGTSQADMDRWEQAVYKYIAKGTYIPAEKQNILNSKEVVKAQIFLDKDKIEIIDGRLFVYGSFVNQVDGKVYSVTVRVGGQVVNGESTGKLTIGMDDYKVVN